MTMVGRVASGLSVEAAQREVDTIARSPVAAFARPPWVNLSRGLSVSPLQEAVTADARPALVAIFGAVLVVLLVASVNVTNLLLARGSSRRAEFAMRAALGAARSRLIRQVLAESLVLTAVGGAVGLGVAIAGVKGLVAIGPPGWPSLTAMHVDLSAFAFALGLVFLIGIGVGLVPAVDASRQQAGPTITEASRRTTRGSRTRDGLVVAEVALALMLLCGAGLLWRSVTGLLDIPPGFDPASVLTLRVQVSGPAFSDAAPRRQRFLDLAEAIKAVPGVTAVAVTSQLPLSGDHDSYGAYFASAPNASPDGDGAALRYAVTSDYFAAMHIPLVRGRLLDGRDRPGAAESVLVNESYARRVFGTTDPVGQRVRFGPEATDTAHPWDTIVGVVGDVKQDSLGFGQPDAFYVATGAWAWVDPVQSFVIRTTGDPGAAAPAIVAAMRAVDREHAIERVIPLSSLVVASEATRIFVLRIFEVFALVTMLLAAIGIYGVLSGSVAERTREIGVRTALGATRTAVLALVGRQAATLTGVGMVLGLGGALVASRAVASLLFGVTRFDPITYLAVALALTVVSGIACAVPAWRATRVDPVQALRAE